MRPIATPATMGAEPALFEVAAFGRAPLRRLRRARPLPDLDWGSLDPSAYPARLVERARRAWTFGAWLEHRTGAQFAAMATALFDAGAPLDLAAMAADVVLDEALHVELNARLAMQLGGGAPLVVSCALPDFGAPIDADPRLRAAAFAVHTCLVGEAVSVPVLAATGRAAHPVVAAVLARIARDEGPHAKLGEWVLDALGPWTEDERARLTKVADDAIAALTPLLDHLPPDPSPTEADAVRALGWLPARRWADLVRATVTDLHPRIATALGN